MNQPWNEVKASSIPGVVLDCDLSTGAKIGGGAATDNTAAINALLATASATNPIKLILDGPSLVTGLSIATLGHTWIEGLGWDTGIYIKSGSNADPINNGKVLPFDGGTQPVPSGANVIFRNFFINGNRGNGTTGDSTSGNPRGISGTWWYCNLNLVNLVGVRIEGMYLYDSPAYSIRLNGCSDVVVQNNTIINPNVTFTNNEDGVHIDGPASNIRVVGNYINNNFSDDAIAINAPEGYGGAISNVVIEGNIIVNCLSAVRAYATSEAAQVGIITIANNMGNVGSGVFLFGFSGGSGDLLRKVTASNNVFSTAGSWVHFESGSAGDCTFTDCTWLNPIAAGSFISCDGQTISCITINDCRIYRTTAGNNTSSTLLAASGATTIKKLIIDGFYVVNEQGQSYAAIAEALAMANITISDLHITSFDYTNIALLADSYTGIASIAGAWQPETNIQSKTGAYTLLPTDRTVLGNTTSASFAVTLPAKSYAGERHTIKNTGTANTLTVTGTVDGSANPTLASLAKMTVLYDGTNWWTV